MSSLLKQGGSGNKDAEVAESIQHGVGKINISRDMKKVLYVALEDELKSGSHEPNALYLKSMDAVKEIVIHNSPPSVRQLFTGESARRFNKGAFTGFLRDHTFHT